MMDPKIGKAAVIIASFLILGSLLSLAIVERGSAEAVISVATIGIAVALIALVGLFARLSR